MALAVLIHAELALMVGFATYFWAPREAELAALRAQQQIGQPETIELNALDEETSRKIIAELEQEQEKAKEEEAKKEIESPDAPGQVVELAKPEEEKRPEDAKFAAEYDSSVEKESKKYGKFDAESRQGDRGGDSDKTVRAQQASAAKQPTAGQRPGQLALKMPGQNNRPASPGTEGEPGPPSKVTRETLELPPENDGTMGVAGGAVPRQVGGGAPNAGAPASAGAPSILPSDNQLARAIGSGTQDHLGDIDEGDETALNAKKWKFASFFNRVKQQVRDHWRPGDEYRRRDPSGSIYGSKDRYTLLRVQLKPDGTLANVALESPSGVEFLDDVAIDAFKQAQPFPNPPRQLVEQQSGLINFRFGFYFELSGAPKMKVFRYNSM